MVKKIEVTGLNQSDVFVTELNRSDQSTSDSLNCKLPFPYWTVKYVLYQWSFISVLLLADRPHVSLSLKIHICNIFCFVMMIIIIMNHTNLWMKCIELKVDRAKCRSTWNPKCFVICHSNHIAFLVQQWVCLHWQQ